MDPYIGEIRAFGFNWVPDGWYACNGQTLNIQGNQTLYAVLGTTYGGDGQTTFKLPNLNPTPVSGQPGLGMVGTGTLQVSGNNYALGQVTGAPGVTLTSSQIPTHGHSVNAITLQSPAVTVPVATNTTYLSRLQVPSTQATALAYTTDTTTNATLNPATVGASGAASAQAHENHQPYLAVNFCINWNGEYPAPA